MCGADFADSFLKSVGWVGTGWEDCAVVLCSVGLGLGCGNGLTSGTSNQRSFIPLIMGSISGRGGGLGGLVGD